MTVFEEDRAKARKALVERPSAGHGTVITDLHRRTDVQNKHDILEAMFSNG